MEEDVLFVMAIAARHKSLRPQLTTLVRQHIDELREYVELWKEEAAQEQLLMAWGGVTDEHQETTSN